MFYQLACRVVARCVDRSKVKRVRLRQGYRATAPKAFGAGGKGITLALVHPNYKCPLVNARPDADFKYRSNCAREIDRKTQCRFSSAMASIWKSGEYDPNCEPLIVSANPGSTLNRNVPARFRSAGCKHRKTGTCGGSPSRSSPRYVARQKCPPSLKLRRDSLHSPLRRERRLEARGFEPLTSSLQSWRSTN